MSKNTDKTTLENSVSKNNKTIKNTGNKITMSNEKSNPTTTSKKVSKTPKLANFKPVSEADLAKNKNIIEIMAEEKTTKKKISPKTPEKSTGKTPEKLSQEIDPEKLGKKEVMNENLSESKIPEKFSENEKRRHSGLYGESFRSGNMASHRENETNVSTQKLASQRIQGIYSMSSRKSQYDFPSPYKSRTNNQNASSSLRLA